MPHPLLPLLRTALVLLAIVALPARALMVDENEPKIERTTLGTAKVMIAVAPNWNHRVLLLAHGLRAADAPLSGDFAPYARVPGQLLSEGWLVAATSYRQNAPSVADAVADLAALRAYIVKTYGAPTHVYVLGTSLGGAIATRLAEQGQGQYAGVLAIGATLGLGKDYTNAPQMPLLFMSNQNEMAEPSAYTKALQLGATPPALWTIKRDGHCNTTDEEDLAAMRALLAWVTTGKVELAKDATIAAQPPPSVAKFQDGGATAKVIEVTEDFGNLTTEFVAADLAKLGMPAGGKFTVALKGQTVTPTLVSRYADVPRGEWLAFVQADGRVQLAINFGNAAAALKAQVYDVLTLAPAK